VSAFAEVWLPLSPDRPSWQATQPIEACRRLDMHKDDDMYNDSILSAGAYVGTYPDALLHLADGGADVAALSPDALIGLAMVLIRDLPWIDAPDLEKLSLLSGTKQLLSCTKTSDLRSDNREYWTEAALTIKATRWVVERGVYCPPLKFVDAEAILARMVLCEVDS
jgi:kynurenine formamidase